MALACLLACSCALIGGCAKKDAKSQTAGAAAPVEKTVERGPVRITVHVEKGTITIAEKVNLRIEVVAGGGVEVDMPSFGEKLNEFEIMNFREWSGVPVGAKDTPDRGAPGSQSPALTGTKRWTQEYVLETFLSGEQEIPAITVKFHDKRDPSKTVDGEIASEPFKVKVTSLLAGEFDPKKFRDIKGTVELPVERQWGWLWWGAVVGGVAVVLVVAVVVWRRMRRVAVARPLPPHDWAFFALLRLEEDRLIEAGLVQEFYFRLSGIVREYIERRFGLMAPERTTPEFLNEVRGSAALSGEHKGLLGDFLQAADMVKFARYEPAPGEVVGALTTARAFVEQTTPDAGDGSVRPAASQIPGSQELKPAETAEVAE